MSNSWFQFKQFRIGQEHCAMKVTTDACIQGAWTPLLPGVKRVLDIGTGTALLSLMLAQRSPEVMIEAIELDAGAAKQARENIARSGWKERITVYEGDACSYQCPHKYDLIICNPPFFNNSLQANTAQKNMARHTASFTQHHLLQVLAANLEDDGYASVLLPMAEYKLWSALLEQNGWQETARLMVRHTAGADVKRVVSLCRRAVQSTLTDKDDVSRMPTSDESLVIKEGEAYTAAFTALLSPFYLNL